MKLVKDLINDQTVYYWVEDADTLEALSPHFRSFVQAEEWWKEFMFSQFRGEERRRSFRDRRQDHKTREEVGNTQEKHNKTVRRVTDLSLRVEIDLHQEKS